MLTLDSPKWCELYHAYGPASDIPRLLMRLRTCPDEDTWDDVWSCLCHQGTVYTATYAAVPHIAALLQDADTDVKVNLVIFLGSVAGSTDRQPIPDFLEAEYVASIKTAAHAAKDLVDSRKWPQVDFVYLLESVAALYGCTVPGQVLHCLADGEIQTYCPECKQFLLASVRSSGFFLYAADQYCKPASDETEVVPCDLASDSVGSEPNCANNFSWLVALASQSGQAMVAFWLRCLYGLARCPKCSATFDLIASIEAEFSQ
jgi:hypothetical protein